MNRPNVLFLDVNETLLDLEPLKVSVTKALGGQQDLLPLWFTTMLHYSLVTTVADRYEDFGEIGANALRMVARNHEIDLSEAEAELAIAPIRSLPPHPDVEPALKSLQEAGFQLVTLTNSSSEGVAAQMKHAKLDQYLTARLSIGEIGLYKPHSHTYRWAARRLKQPIEDCLLIAAHGWDIAGAIWAGMRGAFVARPGAQLYPAAPAPEIEEANLGAIAQRLIALPTSS